MSSYGASSRIPSIDNGRFRVSHNTLQTSAKCSWEVRNSAGEKSTVDGESLAPPKLADVKECFFSHWNNSRCGAVCC